jgi:CubicO group peptidase (beta-lactamase class C family)
MKHESLKKLSLITLLLLTLASCSNQTSTSTEPVVTQQKINFAVESLTPRANELLQKTGVPGMAIAVVHKNKVIFAKGFGVRTIGTDTPVDADTVFQLASLSKSLSSTVAAAVVGEGRVQWDDPIAKYLPGFTLSNAEIGAKVTIADMFAHRSGLPGEAGDALQVLGCKRMEVIDRLKVEPLYPYLTHYDYTNFGITTGAQAVANATGLPWEVLSQQLLYDRLGMASTSSTWADYNNRANKSAIHFKNKQGQWIVSSMNDDVASPAGGASSSVNDMAKWMMLQLNGGSYRNQHIIDKAALAQTHEPHVRMQPATATRSATYYGLGMVITNDSTGRLRLNHSGGFPQGAATTFELLPSENLGIVILTNGVPMGLPETLAQEFFDIVEYGSVQRDWYSEIFGLFHAMDLAQGKLAGINPPSPPVPAPPENDYVGNYFSQIYGPATIQRSGNDLLLTLKPCETESTFTLSHWSGNTFGFPFGHYVSSPTSALDFTPGNGNQAAKITIEYLDTTGLGAFTKIP